MEFIQVILIWAVPTLFAITMREAAFGLTAKFFNDPTAWQCGRVTLNPVPHFDFIGTFIIPIVCLVIGGRPFGWAKPTPIITRNMKPRTGMFIVAFSGIIANLLMAIAWAILMLHHPKYGFSSAWFSLAQAGVIANLSLATIHILPIPPFDGGKILQEALPYQKLWIMDFLQQYGVFIFLGLMLTGILDLFLGPVFIFYSIIVKVVAGIF